VLQHLLLEYAWRIGGSILIKAESVDDKKLQSAYKRDWADSHSDDTCKLWKGSGRPQLAETEAEERTTAAN
jgi:hypothetical protein